MFWKCSEETSAPEHDIADVTVSVGRNLSSRPAFTEQPARRQTNDFSPEVDSVALCAQIEVSVPSQGLHPAPRDPENKSKTTQLRSWVGGRGGWNSRGLEPGVEALCPADCAPPGSGDASEPQRQWGGPDPGL